MTRPLLALSDFVLVPDHVVAHDPDLHASFLDFEAALAQSPSPYTETPLTLTNPRECLRYQLEPIGNIIIGRTHLYPRHDAGLLAAGTDSVVHPARRGRGIGSILLIKAITLAGQLGFSHLHADVERDNEASRRRFEKLIAANLAFHGDDSRNFVSYIVPTSAAPAALHAALAPRTAEL